MKKEINDLLLKMHSGENCIGETANKLLELFPISEDKMDANPVKKIGFFKLLIYHAGKINEFLSERNVDADSVVQIIKDNDRLIVFYKYI